MLAGLRTLIRRPGSICDIDLLGNDALGTKPARMGEGGQPIFWGVLVEQDASLSIAEESRQRSL
jgi:hypothetical protein